MSFSGAVGKPEASEWRKPLACCAGLQYGVGARALWVGNTILQTWKSDRDYFLKATIILHSDTTFGVRDNKFVATTLSFLDFFGLKKSIAISP